MRYFLVLLLIMALPQHAAADSIKRGRLLVQRNCSRCHAIGRHDESKHPQAPPFRQVMKVYPAEDLSEALGEGLVTGHPDMPEFKFPPRDVGAIVDYLHTLETP